MDNFDFNKDFYKFRYKHLRAILEAMIDSSLGKDYYNYGVDTYTCDEVSGYDMMYKINKKTAKRYEKHMSESVNNIWNERNGESMKIKFRGKIININNEEKVNPKKYFNCIWNGYSINIVKNSSVYEACVDSPVNGRIVNYATQDTMGKMLQECFNNISSDIDDMREITNEYNQWLEKVKEYE